jgi:hypothetical protein
MGPYLYNFLSNFLRVGEDILPIYKTVGGTILSEE